MERFLRNSISVFTSLPLLSQWEITQLPSTTSIPKNVFYLTPLSTTVNNFFLVSLRYLKLSNALCFYFDSGQDPLGSEEYLRMEFSLSDQESALC